MISLRKATLILLLFLTGNLSLLAQINTSKELYFKASGGRMVFGTGDIIGFGSYIEGAKNLILKPKKLVNKLLIGCEFSFQVGTENPKIENPTPEEFFGTMFHHESNLAFTPKLTYYPFSKIAKGLNVAVGPTIGYSAKSHETRAERTVYSPTVVRRMSELRFKNEMVVGYTVSAGYEIFLQNSWFAGARIDLINFDNGDFNNFIGLKLGYKW